MNKTVVLVVEDDRPIRNLIVTTLKMHDYKYLTANNGVSANNGSIFTSSRILSS